MALIDDTYFKGPLTIGQLDTLPVAENVSEFIEKYEPEFMRKLMGGAFYKLFTDGLAANEPRMEALRDGGEFTIDGELFIWEGFVNTQLESPAANYVYCKYLRDQATQNVGIGVVGTNAENATRVKYWAKDVRAWNEMVTVIGTFYGYVQANKDVYPEFPFKKVQQYFRRHGKLTGDSCCCPEVSTCCPECNPLSEWCYINTFDL